MKAERRTHHGPACLAGAVKDQTQRPMTFMWPTGMLAKASIPKERVESSTASRPPGSEQSATALSLCIVRSCMRFTRVPKAADESGEPEKNCQGKSWQDPTENYRTTVFSRAIPHSWHFRRGILARVPEHNPHWGRPKHIRDQREPACNNGNFDVKATSSSGKEPAKKAESDDRKHQPDEIKAAVYQSAKVF